MADTIKNQHYVPQSYLRRFAQNDQIWVYDKFKAATNRTFHTAVKNVASETHFYDIPAEAVPAGTNIDPQFIEKTFAKLEFAFTSELDGLLSRIENYKQVERLVDHILGLPIFHVLLIHLNPAIIRKGRLIERQRRAIALFMAYQILRTREFRNWNNELQEKLTKSVSEKLLEMRGEPTIGRQVTVRFPGTHKTLSHLQLLLDPKMPQRIYECLAQNIWSIGVNLSGQPLYTSDNPIVKRAHLDVSGVSNSGWCSKGIQIAYPLTPRYILILWERSAFGQLAYRDGRLRALSTENITYLNSLQVMQSYRQVYCSEMNFDLADQICVDHPPLCNPERPRIQVGN